MLRLALVCLACCVLGGCASPAVSTGTGVCLALSPHMPQTLRQQDTVQTKVEGYRRNTVYEAVCPAPSGGVP